MPIIWERLATILSSPKEKCSDFHPYFLGEKLWLHPMKRMFLDNQDDKDDDEEYDECNDSEYSRTL
jgi:hypothetical protein